MSWNEEDNKRYRGYLDDQYVALSEDYEVCYFVDAYLCTRGFDKTDANRQTVREGMARYPGLAPIKRKDLAAFLDKKYGKA